MKIEVSAPGRICLFGEHQDFLGLAVISAAIDLDITVTGQPRHDTVFAIDMPDLTDRDEPDYDEFDAAGQIPYRRRRDYVRAATNVLRRRGVRAQYGYDCEIHGTIPINAGTSSSSALTTAWVAFLMAAHDGQLSERPEEIAKVAYLSEVKEFDEPGGMMDHYTSAIGNLLYIDCREPIRVTHLPARPDGFVLGDTGVSKDTTDTLRKSRDATNEGLATLQERIPDFDFKTTPTEQAAQYFDEMRDEVRRRIKAHFVNRDLCQDARTMLASEDFDSERLGEMLYEHQVQLRDGIGVSHPKLDQLIDAAMEAGALGGKLNGSGCGGAMFAYAPGKQNEVAEAITRAGGDAYIIALRGGVRVHN